MDKIKSIYITLISSAIILLIIVIVVNLNSNKSKNAVPTVKIIGENDVDWQNYDIWEDDFSENITPKLIETQKPLSFPIDVNTAIFEELIQIKGIGELTANNIISYRNEHGLFKSIDELDNVTGIGQASIESWKEFLYVDEILVKSEDTYVSENSMLESNLIENKLININKATIEELESLDGIGSVTAQKIYDYAEKKGFETIDDLINIDGIGEKKLDKLRPYICV